MVKFFSPNPPCRWGEKSNDDDEGEEDDDGDVGDGDGR